MQSSRSEAFNLIRGSLGRLPHIAVVTAEPLPTRFAAIALGTGDVDCVYHFALHEMRAAIEEIDNEDQMDMLKIMLEGNRLRDISDLPFDLATSRMGFVPGLELSRRFYWEAVRPVLEGSFCGLPHSTALIGPGSETLGFDDEMSTDHGWGPRLQLFLRPDDWESQAEELDAALRDGLPHSFLGYPTNFGAPNPDDNGVQLLEATESGPVNHRVETQTIGGFFCDYLNFDIDREIGLADWLTFPQQKLRTITAGGVFHDGIGLESVRARFSWYPPDVWRYLLAAGWARIGQEEHLMGRAGLVGDELGSALIGARLVRDVMRLCFLMERKYAPYPKWFGTAFAELESAKELTEILLAVQRADGWQERDRWLEEAYGVAAARHNRLGLTDPMPETATRFFGRPFRVMALHGFAEALLGTICDAEAAVLAQRRPIGSIDQFSDSTDLLEAAELRPSLRALYGGG